MVSHAFIFPGQGSQVVGMGRDLAAGFTCAREVFQEVDDALNQDLSRLMFEGPADELVLTENAQPAILTVSLAVMRVLEKIGGVDLRVKSVVIAGHSLGEYSALTAASAFSLVDAIRLVKLRGQTMQNAVPIGVGAMAALLGTDMEQARAICSAAARDPATGESEVVEAANDNGGGQIVISGHRTAIERAMDIAKARGVKRVILLPVSVPLHCALMAPVATVMAEALMKTSIRAPVVPLVENLTAAKEIDPSRIRDLLVAQCTGPVRWRECVLAMVVFGADSFIEIGAGKLLAGMNKRIVPDVACMSVGTPTEVEAVLKII